MNQKVKAKDYNRGKKRVNISIDLSDFEDLVLISKNRGIELPGTTACSILVQEVRREAAALRKAGYNPDQTHLFNAVRIKTKGKKVS